ncbi:MAG: DUF4149 domain-containing protein [Verrucomicrobia bacterium]|nr:DUF4149 domain-containing protein [Verrucomicrobiota bacterium]MCF7707346.1 DUF4149 domain-containing protein [Verrucomicrobiota bacterium]
MIALLRIIGLINASVWLGAAVFFTFSVSPALRSKPIIALFSTGGTSDTAQAYLGALYHIVLGHFHVWQITCAIIALACLLALRVLSGKPARLIMFYLLIGLLGAGLVGRFWIQPELKRIHTIRFSTKNDQTMKLEYRKTYLNRYRLSTILNILSIVGISAFFLKSIGESPEKSRFSRIKFNLE